MSSRANYSVTKQRRHDNKQAQTWHEHLHHSFTETDWWEKRDGKNNSITRSGRDHGGFRSSRHSGGLTRSKTVWRQKLMLRSGTGKVDEDSEHITSYKLWTVAISSVNPLNIHINVEKDAAHDFRCFLVILTFFRSFWEKNSSFSLSRINLFASLFCMFNLRCSGYLVCLFSALNDTAVVPASPPSTGDRVQALNRIYCIKKTQRIKQSFGWFPTQVRLSWSTWSAECGSDFGCVNANLSANWQLQFKTRTRETGDIRTCF